MVVASAARRARYSRNQPVTRVHERRQFACPCLRAIVSFALISVARTASRSAASWYFAGWVMLPWPKRRARGRASYVLYVHPGRVQQVLAPSLAIQLHAVRQFDRHGRQRPWPMVHRPEQSPLTGAFQCILQIARSPLLVWSLLAQLLEPPRYGPVCQVVWEGRSREAPPYPDLWRFPGMEPRNRLRRRCPISGNRAQGHFSMKRVRPALMPRARQRSRR